MQIVHSFLANSDTPSVTGLPDTQMVREFCDDWGREDLPQAHFFLLIFRDAKYKVLREENQFEYKQHLTYF